MSKASFLPEDYLDHKAERRTNFISLTLFAIVMVSVFAAFLVTNRQWSQIKDAQRTINASYVEAATKIERLNELERQKDQMLGKAELAAALVERVPRSILFAELIERMPPRVGLLQFELKSEKIRAVVEQVPKRATGRLRGPMRARTVAESVKKPKKVEAPRYKVLISMVGTAPTDRDVSRFLANLNAYPLLQGVRLEFTEEREIDDALMRRFKIHMQLNPDADIRNATAMGESLDRNVMDGKMKFTPTSGRKTAAAGAGTREGR